MYKIQCHFFEHQKIAWHGFLIFFVHVWDVFESGLAKPKVASETSAWYIPAKREDFPEKPWPIALGLFICTNHPSTRFKPITCSH